METAPSPAAWALLAALVFAPLLGSRRLDRRRAAEREERRFDVSMPAWVLPTASVLATVPAGVALAIGAPWHAVLWWVAFAPPGAGTIVAVFGSAVLVVAERKMIREATLPDERATVYTQASLVLGAPVAAALVAMVLFAGDVAPTWPS